MRPGNIGNIVPKDDPGAWMRRLRDLQNQINELRGAKTGNAMTIDGPPGIVVANGGGISVDAFSGGTVSVTIEADPVHESAAVNFVGSNATPGTFAQLVGFDSNGSDPGKAIGLVLTSNDGDADGIADSALTLGNFGSIDMITTNGARSVDLQMDAATGTGSDAIDGGAQFSVSVIGTTVGDGFIVAAGPTSAIYGLSNADVGWTSGTSGEQRAQKISTRAYVPVRASSFPVSSSSAVKQDVVPIPFDTLATITAASASSWRYIAEHAADPLTHIGPMAEDLPDALVHDADGIRSVDLLSLVGVLWDGVGQLAQRVADLERRASTTTDTLPVKP